MTRQEQTGTRDLTFNDWCRKKLPDSDTGMSISDIDFYMWNWLKHLKTKDGEHLLVEVKTRNKPMGKGQAMMYKKLSKWISEGASKEGWRFKGFFCIKFENTFFNDGKVFVNDKESSEEEIIKLLSL